MKDFIRASLILFQAQLMSSLRSKRLLICAVLAAGPVAFAFMLVQVVPSDERVPITEISWALIGQVVCPVLALVFGSAVVSEEVSDRTITYLFSRPIHRASVLIGRWLAALLIVAVLLTVSGFGTIYLLTSTFSNDVPIESPFDLAFAMVAGLTLAAAVYSAAFTALGTLVKNPMIWGIAYVFAFEVLLVNSQLPGNLQRMTIQFHVRSLVHGWGVEAWEKAEIFELNDLITFGGAGIVLFTALFVWLGIAGLVLSKKQYELSA